MANGVNKVTLIGNLGGDPQLNQTQKGLAVANFNIATNERRGEKDFTEWHRVVVWGKLAETCNEYLAKGRQVHVEGRLRTRNYKDKEGVTRYITEIHASQVTFLGSRPQEVKSENTQLQAEDEELLQELSL